MNAADDASLTLTQPIANWQAKLGWTLTIVTREVGPVLQQWLEIRDVEVEGIHHASPSQILRISSRMDVPFVAGSVIAPPQVDRQDAQFLAVFSHGTTRDFHPLFL